MSNFIPVSELSPHLDDEHKVAWNIQLPPHLNPERLEVNTTRLARFGRIAGFSGISLEQYQGEQTTFDAPAIGGAFNDGSAAAVGSAKASKAPRVKGSLYDPSPMDGLPPRMKWPIARVLVNKPEITSQIADQTARGKDNHQVWANKLDSAFRHGLVSNAKQNLLMKSEKHHSALDVMWLGFFMIDTVQADIPGLGIDAALLATFYAGDWMTWRKQMKDRRLSLAPYDFQLDRFAVAATYSSLRFVRARGE